MATIAVYSLEGGVGKTILAVNLAWCAAAEIAARLDRKGGKVPLLPVHSTVDRRRNLHAAAIEANPDWPVSPMASIVEAMAVRRKAVGACAPRTANAQAFATLWQAIERKLVAKR